MATGVVSGHRSCPVGTGGAKEYGGGLPAGSQLPQPIGFRNAAGEKKALVKMMGQKKIPIIEDNIHGELYFGKARPATLKSMDRRGLVLHCASFSKILSPGLRVGWALPGRFADRVKRLKMNSTVESPTLNQQVVAQFLKTGGFERHLRRLRTALKNQISNTALAIARHFPDGTRITAPQGGSPCGWSWRHRWMASRFFRRPASDVYPFFRASSAPRRAAIATISASAAAIPGVRRWNGAS
jgi:DNA-binding transcriptional MocR family regulator